MLQLPQNNDLPTCGVIIEKNEEEEKVCTEPATQMVTLLDPDDQTSIMAVVLVCDAHDKALEEGKSLIFEGDDGSRLGVQYKSKEE